MGIGFEKLGARGVVEGVGEGGVEEEDWFDAVSRVKGGQIRVPWRQVGVG